MFSYYFIQGGSAVDAVEAAVRELEDDENFNAGRGSLLNDSEKVECDAMIMDGHTLNSGMSTQHTVQLKLRHLGPPQTR